MKKLITKFFDSKLYVWIYRGIALGFTALFLVFVILAALAPTTFAKKDASYMKFEKFMNYTYDATAKDQPYNSLLTGNTKPINENKTKARKYSTEDSNGNVLGMYYMANYGHNYMGFRYTVPKIHMEEVERDDGTIIKIRWDLEYLYAIDNTDMQFTVNAFSSRSGGTDYKFDCKVTNSVLSIDKVYSSDYKKNKWKEITVQSDIDAITIRFGVVDNYAKLIKSYDELLGKIEVGAGLLDMIDDYMAFVQKQVLAQNTFRTLYIIFAILAIAMLIFYIVINNIHRKDMDNILMEKKLESQRLALEQMEKMRAQEGTKESN